MKHGHAGRRHDTAPRPRVRARPRHRHGRIVRAWSFVKREFGSLVVKAASLTIITAIMLLILFDGSVVVMKQLDPRLEKWVADRVGAPDVSVGAVSFSLGSGDDPAGLTLENLRIGGTDEQPSITLPKLSTGFSIMDSIAGNVRPRTLTIGGARIILGRDRAGVISVAASDEPGAAAMRLVGNGAGTPDPSEILGAIANIRNRSEASSLQTLHLEDVGFTFDDARSGRVWKAGNASGTLHQRQDGISAAIRASFNVNDGAPMAVRTSLSQSDVTGETRIVANFQNASPTDIADQVGALHWLRLIDAPVEGSLAATFRADGTLGALSGQLTLGAGEITPMPGRRIGFDGAKAYFRFDPEKDLFTVDTLDIDSSYGVANASGTVQLEWGDSGTPAALTGEMKLANVTVTVPEFLTSDLKFGTGAVTARVMFDPFRIDIGQASLTNDTARMTLDGTVRPLSTHWDIALNAATRGLGREVALELWPSTLRPNLRNWIDTKVESGTFTEFRAYLRQGPSDRSLAFDFAFEDAAVRPLPDMPPITGARGTGQLVDDRFDIVVDQGRAETSPGQLIDLSGSRFTIADTRQKPAIGEIHLTGSGPIPGMLALIDKPPLRFLERAGREPDLAQGMAKAEALITLPIKKGIRGEDVAAQVTADLVDVSSDTLVPGRSITADRLHLVASNDALRIDGDVVFSGVPMTARFDKPLNQPGSGASVTGQMKVTPATVAALGIPLPSGTLAGAGSATYTLDLQPDTAPRYQAAVGLSGARVTIPGLGWTKPPSATGRLSLNGQLGDAPTVDRFEFDGPGLRAEGRMNLDGPRLAGIDLSRFRYGGWLDAPVRWRPTANGSDISIAGGTIDLRNGLRMDGSDSGGSRISLAPDRVIITDNIVLTGVRGDLTTKGGSRGRFTGKLNGGPLLDGVIQPGGAVYVSSDDGGGVLRAAGIFRNAIGGDLRVALTPRDDAIDGAMSLKGTRVLNAPVLAEILNIASIVGIADRLSGPGIGFDDVQGRFNIAGGRILVRDARAIGPSLGVTLDGVYDTRVSRLNMEGVVSPLYAVNGLIERLPVIGRILGGRPGEGLLGATFRLTGSAEDPGISVNPLSMLTPGATREIFQSRAATNGGR